MNRVRKTSSATAAPRTRKPRSKSSTSRAAGDGITFGDRPGFLWDRPGYLIRRLHQIYCGLFYEDCGAATITPLQYGMLTVLSERPDGCDIGALAFQLGTDRSSTADVARRLAGRGYLKQDIAKDDRRKVVSRITEKGRAFVKQVDPLSFRSQDRLLEPLSLEHRRVFMDVLKTLVDTYNDKGRAKLRF
jgi:DNA-binding MarR family transcriptional regulator